MNAIDPEKAPLSAIRQALDQYTSGPETVSDDQASAHTHPVPHESTSTSKGLTDGPGASDTPSTGSAASGQPGWNASNIPSEAPAQPSPDLSHHNPKAVRAARRLGLNDRQIAELDANELAEWIIDQQHDTQPTAPPQPATSQPSLFSENLQHENETLRTLDSKQPLHAPGTSQNQDQDQENQNQDQQEIDWGQDDKGIPYTAADYPPHVRKAIEAGHHVQNILKRLGQIETALQQIHTAYIADQRKKTFQTLDRMFQKHPQIFGKGTRDELYANPSANQLFIRRRQRFVDAMKDAAGSTLEQRFAEVFQELYGSHVPASATGQTGSDITDADATDDDAIKSWNQQTLLKPSRTNAPAASGTGREQAIQYLEQLRRQFGMTADAAESAPQNGVV